MAQIAPDTGAPSEPAPTIEEKSIVLSDAESDLFKKFMGKIQEKYDLVEKKSDFDIFYDENMNDFELGAFDVLFCPKILNKWLYVYALLIKCIELTLISVEIVVV